MTTATLPQTGTWAIDTTHSEVSFSVRHLMISKVRGGFAVYEGTIDLKDPITTSTVNVTIDAASITTGVEDRDGHLTSPDFFDAEQFPTITFVSTGIAKSGSGYTMTGDLTLKGVTKSVDLDLVFNGSATDPYGAEKASFSASTTVDRESFGLTWNAALEAGGVVVGKDVAIELEIQAVRS